MGQISEDVTDGTVCQLCLQYFTKDGQLFTHGFPVVCKTCWESLSEKEKKKYQKAKVATF